MKNKVGYNQCFGSALFLCSSIATSFKVFSLAPVSYPKVNPLFFELDSNRFESIKLDILWCTHHEVYNQLMRGRFKIVQNSIDDRSQMQSFCCFPLYLLVFLDIPKIYILVDFIGFSSVYAKFGRRDAIRYTCVICSKPSPFQL